MPKQGPEHRSEVMHVRVRPRTKREVARLATGENRKLSDMGSILIEEAVAARLPRARARR